MLKLLCLRLAGLNNMSVVMIFGSGDKNVGRDAITGQNKNNDPQSNLSMAIKQWLQMITLAHKEEIVIEICINMLLKIVICLIHMLVV